MKNINKSGKKKQAFTIVELVIVIAIIAILAAVLIPTFSGLIKASQISADQQLSKNMNTALAIAEVTEGKNTTFQDAIDDIQEAGYTVDKLTPTAEGYHLVWNQETDRIVFLDTNYALIYSETPLQNVEHYHLWKVVHDGSEMTDNTYGFSFYLADNFTGTIPNPITTGLDVGTNAIAAINYERTTGDAQDVIIRTNGGTLTVDAPNDTVNHFGFSSETVITAVADASFHEFGVAGFVEVYTGRYVAETGSKTEIVINIGSAKIDNMGGEIEKAYTTVSGNEGTGHGRNVQLDYDTFEGQDAIQITETINGFKEEAINKAADIAIQNGTLVIEGIVRIGTKGYAKLEDAFNAVQEGETISMLCDYDLEANEPGHGKSATWKGPDGKLRDNCLTINKNNVTFDLNGHVISNLFNLAFKIEGNNITVKNGKLELGYLYQTETPGVYGLPSYALYVCNSENFAVTEVEAFGGINCNNSDVRLKDYSFTGLKFYAVYACNTEVKIEGGKYIKSLEGAAGKLFYLDEGATMEITGGTFEKGTAIEFYGGNLPVVKGGSFNFDPSVCVDTTTYNVTENNGSWTVTAK